MHDPPFQHGLVLRLAASRLPSCAAQVTTSNAVSFQMCPDYVGSPFYPNDSKARFGHQFVIVGLRLSIRLLHLCGFWTQR